MFIYQIVPNSVWNRVKTCIECSSKMLLRFECAYEGMKFGNC